MLKFLRSLVTSNGSDPCAAEQAGAPAPVAVSAVGVPDFDIVAHLRHPHDLPILDWDAARHWVTSIPDEGAQAPAWSACERAWLAHLQAALGPGYRLREKGSALLLSSLEANVAEATLHFVNKTLQRVTRLLDGIAEVPGWGHDILIVFDDQEAYYRYVAHFYPEPGEFALSGGMYIHDGCGHFATVKADLHAIEPVIAHEMTHGALGHLMIPAWLNEGIAVNTEHRLCPPPRGQWTAPQMHERHARFWGPAEIQQFWSGKSFLRPDEGNELSYDLARIIVSQFAADWERFRPFVLAAQADDAGAEAAREHLGVDLGDVVTALLEKAESREWSPDAAKWVGTPERGAFTTAGGATP
jgi:hypothetical protein